MATFQMIPVACLIEPLNPQREETLLERIDELRDSLRTNGLQQPIGVMRVDEQTYRIIWGHRRSIAVTQLGWSHVAAMVYEPAEADVDTLMATENYHRNQINAKEEALFYKRVLPNYPEGTIGLARELNVSQTRVERLLMIADGDPKVLEALGAKRIRLEQAYQINKFESQGYRDQALEYAIKDGMSADRLRRWRTDVQRQGLDHAAQQVDITWKDRAAPVGDVPHAQCDITNHMVPLQFRRVVNVCNDHYNVFLEGLEVLGQMRIIQDVGLYPDFVKLMKRAEALEAEYGGATGPTRPD